mmetsp:Transcript_2572/g.5911  ORF Transcript_2572/g.5911 Transcript_2572/m.5911 type:complete len:227 (-) Transcript_2572:86-766(-)
MPWPADTVITNVGGTNMSIAAADAVVGTCAPQQQKSVSVDLRAPLEPGRYVSYFRLSGHNGKFGHRVWVDVAVRAPTAEERVALDQEEQLIIKTSAASAPAAATTTSSSSSSATAAAATTTTTVSPSTPATPLLVDVPAVVTSASDGGSGSGAKPSTQSPAQPQKAIINDDDDDNNNPPSNKAKYDSQLKQLAAMGFHQADKNVVLLDKHDGDLLAVVRELLEVTF